ncbi:amidohydrolase family protein [Chloroflexota bacterium]
MKIDIYTHFLPPRFLEGFRKRVCDPYNLAAFYYRHQAEDKKERASIYDLKKRLQVMDKYPGLVHVLTPTGHTLEGYAKPDDAVYLSQVYNDELAELVQKYPDKFIAAVACLPLNDIDATMKEIDRAIKELGFKGIHVHTPINGRAIDLPEYWPIYEVMSKYDLPIWLHPTRHYTEPDYIGEDHAKYGLFQVYGWPYATTLAMGRLVCSGLMGKYPNLKIITHHAGAMIPFFTGRFRLLECPYEHIDKMDDQSLSNKSPEYYFKRFYNDTALYGNSSALRCANDFFGADHMLFGTDAPYDWASGEIFTNLTIEAIEGMGISEADKKKIYEDNARAILHLNIDK